MKLDPELVPLVVNRNVNDPPRLHYGLLFPRSALDKIVARYHIDIDKGQPIVTDLDREVFTRIAVSDYLRKKISSDLRIAVPFWADKDMYVMALDDTRSLRCAWSRSWAKKAQPIFKKVQRELRLDLSAMPMWYWSCSRNEQYVPHAARAGVMISSCFPTGTFVRCPSTTRLRQTIIPKPNGIDGGCFPFFTISAFFYTPSGSCTVRIPHRYNDTCLYHAITLLVYRSPFVLLRLVEFIARPFVTYQHWQAMQLCAAEWPYASCFPVHVHEKGSFRHGVRVSGGPVLSGATERLKVAVA